VLARPSVCSAQKGATRSVTAAVTCASEVPSPFGSVPAPFGSVPAGATIAMVTSLVKRAGAGVVAAVVRSATISASRTVRGASSPSSSVPVSVPTVSATVDPAGTPETPAVSTSTGSPSAG
jgi:hypothetical protein